MQQLLSMGALPSTLSSRAKPRDLRFSGPFVEMFFDRAKRKGGTCSALSAPTTLRTLHPNNQCQGQPTISTLSSRQERSGREGPAVPSRPQPLSEPSIRITNTKVSQPSPLCHPDRSEAEGRDLQCPLGRNHSPHRPSQ